MKSYRYNRREEELKADFWDPFVDHIESIYFTGASELLDKQTLAFEYDHFKNDYLGVQ